ncbi:MAG: Gldg family protein [Patescibacteria group bacterium]
MKFKDIFQKIKLNSKKYLRKIGEVLGLRQTKYGANTILAILIVLGILVLINFIFYKENIRFDLTKNKKFTLSDQTKKVLKQIDQEIKIVSFFQKETQSEAENLLKEYQTQNKKIKVEFIDPDAKPALAQKYGIERYGTLVLEMGDRKQEVTEASESDITSGILKLIKKEKKKIYFLTGHGEKDIESGGDRSYTQIKRQLEKENYEVKTINLITKPEIPRDAAVLIIASPKNKILDKEKEIISDFLDKNGKVLILLDPKSEVEEEVGFSDILAKWGIETNNNLVIDPAKYFLEDVGTIVIDKWILHKITENLPSVFFPGVSKVSPKKDLPKDITVQSLAKTSNNSWLEANFGNRNVKFDPGQDEKGPVSIAVAAEKEKKDKAKKTGARLAVFGDSDFAVDAFSNILSNQDLFVNTVNWLAEEEELISIRPKEEEERKVALTGSQSKFVFYLTVVGMPLIVIVGGVAVWVKRKRKK